MIVHTWGQPVKYPWHTTGAYDQTEIRREGRGAGVFILCKESGWNRIGRTKKPDITCRRNQKHRMSRQSQKRHKLEDNPQRGHVTFCWPCIIVYHHSKTNVMHFLFNLLKIKSLYMFRALFAQPQEAIHKRHLLYCVRVMSVGCTRIRDEPVPL
jgi:hypothetical protein